LPLILGVKLELRVNRPREEGRGGRAASSHEQENPIMRVKIEFYLRSKAIKSEAPHIFPRRKGKRPTRMKRIYNTQIHENKVRIDT